MERQLSRSADMSEETLPITAICIIADRNKAPTGFSAVLKTNDEGADADLWRESAFSLWSRPVRYIAVSREVRTSSLPASKTVVTDLTVVSEKEPVPHGYVAVDYTADSREKALRKRFLCVKTESLESCVDAITEIIVLSKTKKTPRDYTQAGEIEGFLVCFKTSIIPATYGIRHTQSERNIAAAGEVAPPMQPGFRVPSAYPQLGVGGGPLANSSSALDNLKAAQAGINAFTIKGAVQTPTLGIDGVQFVVNSRLASSGSGMTPDLPSLPDVSSTMSGDFAYGFQLERSLVN